MGTEQWSVYQLFTLVMARLTGSCGCLWSTSQKRGYITYHPEKIKVHNLKYAVY